VFEAYGKARRRGLPSSKETEKLLKKNTVEAIKQVRKKPVLGEKRKDRMTPSCLQQGWAKEKRRESKEGIGQGRKSEKTSLMAYVKRKTWRLGESKVKVRRQRD